MIWAMIYVIESRQKARSTRKHLNSCDSFPDVFPRHGDEGTTSCQPRAVVQALRQRSGLRSSQNRSHKTCSAKRATRPGATLRRCASVDAADLQGRRR